MIYICVNSFNALGSVTRHLLPAVKPLPTMHNWEPTQQHILVDDEKELRNIPYMGDEMIDETFIKELRELYGGWVDVGGEYDDYLNNAAFIELVNALIPLQNDSNEITSVSTAEDIGAIGGEEAEPKNDKNQFPCHDIFKAISKRFPNKGTPDELHER